VLPSHDSMATSSPVQHELFRFRNPVMLRSQRGTVTCIRSHQVQRRERVFLNVYHLHKCLNTRCLNCCCMGIFHSGIEMFGTEIAFGGSPDESTGIFQCSPMHTISPTHFGDQFELLSSTCVGYTKMSPCHLTKLLDLISPEWPGNSYNLISRNCNHFVEFFLAQIACRNQPPSFVNRCSRLAVSVKCCLPKIITSMDFGSPSAVCASISPATTSHNDLIIFDVFDVSASYLTCFCRFSGKGLTCRGPSARVVQGGGGLGRGHAQDADPASVGGGGIHAKPQTAPVSPVDAAGNAALLRHWSFLRSRGQHPVHPAECKSTARLPVSPPAAPNTMAASAAAAPETAVGNDRNRCTGAMLPADVDAIEVGMSSADVDVSSDDSADVD
jgi:hypothetical protein